MSGDGWADVTLGEIARWFSGATPKAGTPAYYQDGTVPWATIGDIQDRPIRDTATSLTDAGAALAGRLAPVGAVLVSMYGTIGRTGLAEVPMATNQAIAWGVPDQRLCSSEFLFYLVQSMRGHLDSLGRGATQRNINREILREQRVLLPPLPVQRRIVDLIGAFDAHIDALEVQFAAAHNLLGALRSEVFGHLEGTVDLTSVMSDVRSGGTPSRKRREFYRGEIPWLKSGEVDSSWIEDTEERITPEAIFASSAWLVPAGAVVVAMYGATAAEVGYLAASMATNQAVLALVPDPARADGRFAYHWLRHHQARLKAAASGAAQPNLSKAVILREVRYPDLSVAEQARVAQTLDAAAAASENLSREANALRILRSTALAQLFGKGYEFPASYDALLRSV